MRKTRYLFVNIMLVLRMGALAASVSKNRWIVVSEHANWKPRPL
jgi:hypothetical protein